MSWTDGRAPNRLCVSWTDRARSQAGVIGRGQLVRAGLTERQVQWLIHTRQLRRIHPGVYLHDSLMPDVSQRLWAAALWSGGVISHRCAARVLGLGELLPAEFKRPPRHNPPNRHRSAIPRCPVRYSVVSSAAAKSPGPPHRVDLAAQVGRVGNRRLRLLPLANLEPGAHAESERLLHRILRDAGVTGWAAQLPVRLDDQWVYLDVGFDRAMVGIEVDGRRFHGIGQLSSSLTASGRTHWPAGGGSSCG